MNKKIVVLTGAGISAESGISTFRDSDGLWEGHDVMEVASPIGWKKNKALVLDFYNQRRRQLLNVQPNKGHLALVELENQFDVSIITQNVDDLHERAGSKKVIHLHGELLKVRSTKDENLIYDWKHDILDTDKCEKGAELRPHIVWFGEEVPMMEFAISEIISADIVIIVGTSMIVYPAAGLVRYAPKFAQLYYVDPKPNVSPELSNKPTLKIINKNATIGLPKLVEELLNQNKL